GFASLAMTKAEGLNSGPGRFPIPQGWRYVHLNLDIKSVKDISLPRPKARPRAEYVMSDETWVVQKSPIRQSCEAAARGAQPGETGCCVLPSSFRRVPMLQIPPRS